MKTALKANLLKLTRLSLVVAMVWMAAGLLGIQTAAADAAAQDTAAALQSIDNSAALATTVAQAEPTAQPNSQPTSQLGLQSDAFLNEGNVASHTAWMLVCCAMVLFMTAPGLALYYSGLVRKKNVLSVIMQCIFLMSLMTLVWAIYGYSLAFGGAIRSSGTSNTRLCKALLAVGMLSKARP